jgi:hypothetical protein
MESSTRMLTNLKDIAVEIVANPSANRKLDLSIAIATSYFFYWHDEQNARWGLFTNEAEKNADCFSMGPLSTEPEAGNSCPSFTASLDAIELLKSRFHPNWYIHSSRDIVKDKDGTPEWVVAHEVTYAFGAKRITKRGRTRVIAHLLAVLAIFDFVQEDNGTLLVRDLAGKVSQNIIGDVSDCGTAFNGYADQPFAEVAADQTLSLSWDDGDGNSFKLGFNEIGSICGTIFESGLQKIAWFAEAGDMHMLSYRLNQHKTTSLLTDAGKDAARLRKLVTAA